MKIKEKEMATANTRRQFIKNAATVAAGFIILPRHVLGRGYTPPSDKLLVGGIGVGGKGESDIWNFAQSGKAEIAFLCDVDEKRAAKSMQRFPKAKFYKDYREMLSKEHKNMDAVSVSTPDHTHAVATLAAMQLGKHVYVQKPLTHDIYEARMLTEAAEKYKLVTQMGNQGGSGDGVRTMMEWYQAGLIGDAHTIYCWTDRPVWPQGIPWSTHKAKVPHTLDWDLWLGTAPYKNYIDNLVPFNWRGWWDYGTGAIGDMGCHLIEPAYRTVGLGYPTSVECSVGSVYVGEFTRGYFPESAPPSSHIILTFKNPKGGHDIKLHWMDGGIQPERPEELGPTETFGDGGNGCFIIGDKGKMMCGTYGANPQLLPLSKTAENVLPITIPRVIGGADGHYRQWVEACIAGHGSKEWQLLSSPFSTAGPLTEAVLMSNLAIRSFDLRTPIAGKADEFDYPGRYRKLLWNGTDMKVTNFDEANQFVKRQYREGWG